MYATKDKALTFRGGVRGVKESKGTSTTRYIYFLAVTGLLDQ